LLADNGLAQSILGCAHQDQAALRRIYETEASAMLGAALRIVRRRDLAEEIVQDAFVQIWRRAETFDPQLGSARGWLFAIVRNRALNVVRSKSREDLVEGDELDRAVDDTVHDDMLERLPERDALRVCLARLDGKRRTSLILAYIEGFSHGEIAGRLGVPLGTVKAWIRRSLVMLRDCLA
jgi:RNA polymerase sigma-70 factor, ECF subfamily